MKPDFKLVREKEGLHIYLRGDWIHAEKLPDIPPECKDGQRVIFSDQALGKWDTALTQWIYFASGQSQPCCVEQLPSGVQKLVSLAQAAPEQDLEGKKKENKQLLYIGKKSLAVSGEIMNFFRFIGELVFSFKRLLIGKNQMRRSDFWLMIEQCSVQAFGIVALISFLTGFIMSFVGAVQLQKFGAEIYVADLVALAMAREMGPLMVGIIMSGRTGAAFAANLGTMRGNEEIDALAVSGIRPIDFLVIPRLLACTLVVPILSFYAIIIGIIGGLIVTTSFLDVTIGLYWNETIETLNFSDLVIGFTKGIFFGAIIALAGCFRGFYAGNNASAVGQATTSAVVLSITAIIITDALFGVVLNVLGF